jgi:hypothetical protein
VVRSRSSMGFGSCEKGWVGPLGLAMGTGADDTRFKTGYVLAEQPPLGKTDDGKDKTQEWYALFGGEPDIIGSDLAEVAKKIVETTK